MNADRGLYEELERKRNIFFNNKSFVDLCIRAYPLRNANHVAYKVVNTLLIDPPSQNNDNVQSNVNDNQENGNEMQ